MMTLLFVCYINYVPAFRLEAYHVTRFYLHKNPKASHVTSYQIHVLFLDCHAFRVNDSEVGV